MPPKRQKQSSETKPKTPIYLDPAVRRYITEFLPITPEQQAHINRLERVYHLDQTAANLSFKLKDYGFDYVSDTELQEELDDADQSFSQYHRIAQRYFSAPSKHETYRYFWDDDFRRGPNDPPPPMVN